MFEFHILKNQKLLIDHLEWTESYGVSKQGGRCLVVWGSDSTA